jgi:epoxyqueuosine reductase QueG
VEEIDLKTNFKAQSLTAEVKEIASKSGASLVGIVSSHDIDSFANIWVGWEIREYTKKTVNVMPDARSVVVMAYHVWDDMLELAIQKGEEWVYPGYTPLDVLIVAVKNFLEQKGYRAAYAKSISHKRLAQLAGFGNYGKNSLIINPEFGPWLRFAAVVTNAELIASTPFSQNLCGDCKECLKACPSGALTPYKVDDRKCLLGAHLSNKTSFERNPKWRSIELPLTKNSHIMCMKCQKACRFGRERHQA